MKKYVYSYCIMFSDGKKESYKNGFFEYEKITSSKMAGELCDSIKDWSKIKDNYVVLSLNIVGEVND